MNTITGRSMNATNAWQVDFADGETFIEKCKNTHGGFLNMTERIAKRVGVVWYDVEITETATGIEYAANGRTWRLTPVTIAR